MRMPSIESNVEQLELLDPEPNVSREVDRQVALHDRKNRSPTSSVRAEARRDGCPLIVPLVLLDEDPQNPRTEFLEAELDELADDIRQRGILQPIVVHPADAAGRYRIHFGAKRCRAALRAGLNEVPVVVREAAADAYAQVAENHKRRGLTPLDLARFIRSRVVSGESNATIAKQLVMDPTTVAHHLALLDLPPALDEALQSGRCTSPKTLYELGKLHQAQPAQVKALIAGGSEITRAAVAAMRAQHPPAAGEQRHQRGEASLLVQANRQCERLEQTLARLKQGEPALDEADLAALWQRVSNLASRSA